MKKLLLFICLFFCLSAQANTLLQEFGTGEPLAQKSTNTFRLITWNIYKGGMDGLYGDLAELLKTTDFVLIQEFLLNQEQENQIQEFSQSHWAFAKSFQSGEEWTGVATYSRWQPFESIPLVSPGTQPFANTPKMTLITKYQLQNGQELWLVNLHGLNFDITHGAFKDQIQFIVSRLKKHQGPMIFAGDFNTWSDTRWEYLLKKTKELGLQWASLENPLGFFGATLDHIFYRGISNVSYRVMDEIVSSDHNPMLIEFSL